jgi:hypothetical protein
MVDDLVLPLQESGLSFVSKDFRAHKKGNQPAVHTVFLTE